MNLIRLPEQQAWAYVIDQLNKKHEKESSLSIKKIIIMEYVAFDIQELSILNDFKIKGVSNKNFV